MFWESLKLHVVAEIWIVSIEEDGEPIFKFWSASYAEFSPVAPRGIISMISLLYIDYTNVVWM